jgi:hypothetical protein
MQIEITDYESLLSAAKVQPEPQRLLFVFLKASLPEGSTDSSSVQGGQLQPIMCVDKTLDELGSFADLVAESERMEQDWQIVLVGCLSGHSGITPSSDDATKPLTTMVQTVEEGGDLSKYMAFNREGDPVQFGS